jgi:Flp pilus assembly protein TadD
MTIPLAMELALRNFQTGRLEEAEKVLCIILAEQPDHGEALHLLGLIAVAVGQTDQAIGYFSRAIAAQPGVSMYHCNLGVALAAMNRCVESVAAFECALQVDTGNCSALRNLGCVLRDTGEYERAVTVFRQALIQQPGDAPLHNDLGNSLRAAGRIDEAIVCYRKAAEIAPEYHESFSNLAAALIAKNLLSQAVEACRRAIALSPDFATAHHNLGQCLLAEGNFPEGWKEYVWRARVKQADLICRDFHQPHWNGEDLAGKTILIHAEQGIGDAIQFIRFLPQVKARGGLIILDCRPELLRLFDGQFDVDQWIKTGDVLPHFDVHCPMMSLPMALGTTLESIPGSVPYLAANSEARLRWKQRLANDPSLKIGLTWAGNPTHSRDRQRSMPLSNFAPLAEIPGITLYSLQKGAAASQALQMPKLADWTGELPDIAEIAALIVNLDLVITVDTSIAHLAGALGKPVWVLLAFSPDWRWMLDRTDSPWYPTMRLFRQNQRGDWTQPIRKISAALQVLVRDRAF